MYKPIEIDRKNLSIMGVKFPDIQTLEQTANSIGTNMFEGFLPTANTIALIRDYVTGEITFSQFVYAAKNTAYAQ
ncbi:MAG: antitoxin VbhA family protein [Bacteroidales bacterium]|jgi:putative transcriptional regulator|nr:antitoxin VbhA family protein [Bacteroidales bacterium]